MPQQFIPPETKIFPLEERLRRCRSLYDFVNEALTGPVFEEFQGTRMVLTTFARATGTFYAVLVLAEQSFGDQVGMLARALFEGMVDAYWVQKHPVDAQRLAVDHYSLTQLVVAEHWNAHGRRDGDPELPVFPETLRERNRLAQQFGPTAGKHWTRQSLWDRIAQVDDLVPQSRYGELRGRYEDDHMLANLLLHGAPMALNDRIADGPLGTTIAVGASPQHLANGLRHAYWSYQRLCCLIAARQAPSARARLDELYREAWPVLQTITVPALKRAGRNGSCPCGSGRKAKECHGAL